jgi:hypothetical protein
MYDLFFSTSLLLYLPVVFVLKQAVSTLTPEYRKYLCDSLEPYNCAWNAGLSVFSAIGSYNCYRHFKDTGYSCGFVENSLWIDLLFLKLFL